MDGKMNAYKLAEKLMDSLTNEYDCDDYMVMAAELLKQQKYELDLANEFITQRGEFGQFIVWKSLKESNET
jgi:hypothetical protein